MKFIFYVLPILAGVAMTIQSGINSQLRIAINHPFMAAFISFFVGTLALILILLLSKQSLPPLAAYNSINWYKFSGGLFGVFVVTVTLLSVKEIGVANMFVLVIAGQLITAVCMDHFGVLGLNISPITLKKLAGIAFLVAGAWLVNKK
ncbi:MAG: DMT family transporter [Chitinophagaceae bacterium]